MKKLLLVAFVAGTLGFVAGNAFWYLASLLWIDREVAEGIGAVQNQRRSWPAEPSDADAAHRGRGTATIYQGADGRRTLRLTDFEVTNGPDLEVWLVTAEDVTASSGRHRW